MKILILRLNILFVLGFLLFACNEVNKRNRTVIYKRSGTSIDFIDTLRYYSLGKGWINRPSQYGLKVTTYINADCSACLDELISWKKIINELKTEKISFLFYVKIFDFNALELFLTNIDFPYPIIVDKSGNFYKKNALNEDKLYQTYLVDANNKIVLIGNPLYSEKIKELYFATIKKMQ